MNNITINDSKGTRYIPAENILRMESVRAYTVFYEKNGDQHVMCTHLGQVLKRLCTNKELKKVFFRVHRSHIINLNEVKQYHKARGGEIVLSNDTVVAVAIRRKAELLKLLKKLK